MSEHQKPKATLHVGVRAECNCGWTSQAHFGSFSQAMARLEWREHIDAAHAPVPPTEPASQAKAASQ